MSSATKSKRITALERKLGIDEMSKASLIHREWIVIFRSRLEGCGVWSSGGGCVLLPINHPTPRKAFALMLQKQDHRIRDLVIDQFSFCLQQDPFMLDANYPLLEYYLFTAWKTVDQEEPIPPLALPAQLADWILSIKPEEYIHYRPTDWCWQCGYQYPKGSAGPDLKRFLLTRYSKEQVWAMQEPFRGKECYICGGEIKDELYRRSGYSQATWEGSPAARKCEAKKADWKAEIEATQLPEFLTSLGYYDLGGSLEDKVKELFYARRTQRPGVREEYQPSVEDLAKYY